MRCRTCAAWLRFDVIRLRRDEPRWIRFDVCDACRIWYARLETGQIIGSAKAAP